MAAPDPARTSARDLAALLEERRERDLADLVRLLRIPSVSTDPAHAGDVRAAAEQLAEDFRAAGFEAEVRPTGGHPLVLARRRVDPALPTVLVYGHYDVQPPEPLGAWTSPPFEPTVVDGRLVARGASDDKGQMYAHLRAAAALIDLDGELPVNLTFLIEGEEEIGSPHLAPFVREHRAELAADVVLISDSAMIAPRTPTITYGLKGLAYVEVEVETAARDLHSGAYGGGVPNPVQVLAELIAGLKDERGRVQVDGFYDAVRDPGDAERAAFAEAPFDEAEFRADAGVTATPGEAGWSLLERLWARPTLDVNGIGGGFQGEGAKTVIPARARAKISCRLVPDQDPADITTRLRAHLEAAAPAGARVSVRDLHGGRPALTPIDAPAVQAAAAALERVYGRPPVYARTGGTIPVVSEFQRTLGASVVLVGLGLEDDRAHAPDEKLELENYFGGIRVGAELLRAFADLPRE